MANEAETVLSGIMGEGLSGKSGQSEIEIRARMREVLEGVDRLCKQMHLEKTRARISPFRDNVLGSCKMEIIDAEYEGLYYALQIELAERKLVFVPPNLAQFLEKDDLFGEAVNQAFPTAQLEIKNAGNCLATGLNTAAIFHLMRTVEIGLRALAKKLRVKKVKKSIPVELGTWDEVIRELEAKAIATIPRRQKNKREAEFFKGIFPEFRAFKDVWRNSVMHTRCDYDEHVAQSVFVHVRAFMQRLAKEVSE